ncbi:hypothetical protein NDU88_002496, partial [Pleurodeles waltl]
DGSCKVVRSKGPLSLDPSLPSAVAPKAVPRKSYFFSRHLLDNIPYSFVRFFFFKHKLYWIFWYRYIPHHSSKEILYSTISKMRFSYKLSTPNPVTVTY